MQYTELNMSDFLSNQIDIITVLEYFKEYFKSQNLRFIALTPPRKIRQQYLLPLNVTTTQH